MLSWKGKATTPLARLLLRFPPHRNSVSEDEVKDWIRAVFTPAPEHHQVSCLRRLFFEAQALSISDMKTRVEPSNDFVTRKMPVAERLARQKAQEARLTGVHFSPETGTCAWGCGSAS